MTADGRRALLRRLLHFADEDEIDLEFIAREAGDLEMTAADVELHERVMAERGPRFHRELLFVLAHVLFPVDRAESVWRRILEHKAELHSLCGRNLGVFVAAIDWLSNVSDEIELPASMPSEALDAMASEALNDGLTGLLGHSSFYERLKMELARIERYRGDLSLVMIDIDHFKAFNDAYGHRAGDRAIRLTSQVIQRTCRDVDIPARYGGEEFAVLLPETAKPSAAEFAERLRQAVRRAPVSGCPITISLGVASAPADARSAGQLIRAADEALYRSKDHGRNCVTCFEPLDEQGP